MSIDSQITQELLKKRKRYEKRVSLTGILQVVRDGSTAVGAALELECFFKVVELHIGNDLARKLSELFAYLEGGQSRGGNVEELFLSFE